MVSSIHSTKDPDRPKEKVLGHYVFGELIGKGAFASVYRVKHSKTKKSLAVKQISILNTKGNTKDDVNAIMMEIDLLKILNHPNIVKYHGFVKTHEVLYIFLEYCEGGSLRAIYKQKGPLSEQEIIPYLTQVLQGLKYLHDQGVIHRDIKAANILITKDGLAKLADFGVATKVNNFSSKLGQSTVVGTPYWMAPEIVSLEGAVTASDIWSLGCTVIEVLTSNPPYFNLNPMSALHRIVTDDHPPLPDTLSSVAKDFLLQCFQKRANIRISATRLLTHPWIRGMKSKQQRAQLKPVRNSSITLKKQRKPSQNDTNSNSTSKKNVVLNGSHIMNLKSNFIDDDSNNWDKDFDLDSNKKIPITLVSPELRLRHSSGSKTVKSTSSSGSGSSSKRHGSGSLTTRSRSPSKQKLQTKSRSKSILGPVDSSLQPPFDTSLRSFSSLSIDSIDSLKSNSIKLKIDTKIPRKTSKSGASLVSEGSPYRDNDTEDYSDLLGDIDELRLSRLSPHKRSKSPTNTAHPSLPKKNPIPLQQPVENYLKSQLRSFVEEDTNSDYSSAFQETSSITEGKLVQSGTQEEEEEDPFLSSTFDDEPFAEEDFAVPDDSERNGLRKAIAEMEILVLELSSSTTNSRYDLNEDKIQSITASMQYYLEKFGEVRKTIVKNHGILPILEILEMTSSNPEISYRLLCIINNILENDISLQENFCCIGGLPIVTSFTNNNFSNNVRLQAAKFVDQICQSESKLALQMFISCGGLYLLSDFLEEDYSILPSFPLTGISGIYKAFHFNSISSLSLKNDFCRILSRKHILEWLAITLYELMKEERVLLKSQNQNLNLKDNSSPSTTISKIFSIFNFFSQSEAFVKETVATYNLFRSIFQIFSFFTQQNKIIMLRFIKSLSCVPTTLDVLQESNTIEFMCDLLQDITKDKTDDNLVQYKESANNIYHILYNLCRLNVKRQEEAVEFGIVKYLQMLEGTNYPFKEFGLPILCDLAHSGKKCRNALWANNCIDTYLALLSDPYWQVNSLDAIVVWLQEEPGKLEEKLLASKSIKAFIDGFTLPNASSFENFLDPFQKILRISFKICVSLICPPLIKQIGFKLGSTSNSFVQLNLLRILKLLIEARSMSSDITTNATAEPLIRKYDIYDNIHGLITSSGLLVKELAKEIIYISRDSTTKNDYSRHSNSSSRPGSPKRNKEEEKLQLRGRRHHRKDSNYSASKGRESPDHYHSREGSESPTKAPRMGFDYNMWDVSQNHRSTTSMAPLPRIGLRISPSNSPDRRSQDGTNILESSGGYKLEAKLKELNSNLFRDKSKYVNN